jgi:hypothetical protein
VASEGQGFRLRVPSSDSRRARGGSQPNCPRPDLARPRRFVLRHQSGALLGRNRSPLRAARQPVLARAPRGRLHRSGAVGVGRIGTAGTWLRRHQSRGASHRERRPIDARRADWQPCQARAKGHSLSSPLDRCRRNRRLPHRVRAADRDNWQAARSSWTIWALGVAESKWAECQPPVARADARVSRAAKSRRNRAALIHIRRKRSW